MKLTRWRLAWSIIIPVGFAGAFLSGYFVNNTFECMMHCSMQRALLIQAAAQCQSITQPPMSEPPTRQN